MECKEWTNVWHDWRHGRRYMYRPGLRNALSLSRHALRRQVTRGPHLIYTAHCVVDGLTVLRPNQE